MTRVSERFWTGIAIVCVAFIVVFHVMLVLFADCAHAQQPDIPQDVTLRIVCDTTLEVEMTVSIERHEDYHAILVTYNGKNGEVVDAAAEAFRDKYEKLGNVYQGATTGLNSEAALEALEKASEESE